MREKLKAASKPLINTAGFDLVSQDECGGNQINVKLVECPRDAMQGWSVLFPPKIEYLMPNAGWF
jgi:hypothetical protein